MGIYLKTCIKLGWNEAYERVDRQDESLKKLKELPLPYPQSNRGYNPLDIIESFWVCVWLGGARFAHTALIRFDKVLKDIFGWKRVPSVSTYTRFFNKFAREMIDNTFLIKREETPTIH